ncbi:hypothetical protein IJ384_02220 [bacterium]|nr:hypothetical protein [bacterium]
MRVNNVQKNTNFKALQVRSQGYMHYNASEISRCKEKLANTKFIDVIIDSQGLAIKEKMTEVLQRIQSFSLLPQENSVVVNIKEEKEPMYKFSFKDLKEAKTIWRDLCEKTRCDELNYYTNIALWLEEQLSLKK